MADDAKTLQERRRELLRRRIAESGVAAGKSAEAVELRAGQRYRLSSGQRRMWFLQAMDADDTTLNICVAYRLTGQLDPARLRDAVGAVVARHAVLRTNYGVDSEGEPYQVFRDHVETPWQEHDFTDLDDRDDRDRRVEDLARREFGRPFNLADDMPLRITLIRTRPAEFVLLLVVHHICWDDDAWAVFFAELSAAYNSQPLGEPAPQFVAVEVLDGATEPGMADVGYWADKLRPAPEPLELPGVRAAHPSRRAERVTRPLPEGLFGRLEEFAREHSASPFMVLLAAYGVLIRRYTGSPDFLVSVPVTDRKALAQRVIGYFGNTLLLRLTARPNVTFGAYVDAVRDTCLDGFAHQSVGIDRVVREANPRADGPRRHGPAGAAGIQHAQECERIRTGRRGRATAGAGRGDRTPAPGPGHRAGARGCPGRVRIPDRRTQPGPRRTVGGALHPAVGQRDHRARPSPHQPGHVGRR
ncbi:hypothetical protein IWGMT90018_21140 [Mycobacterium kiyosense]|nr:hypothetical protein IWGMT90018_21140 [Mycobacterium kiyosense]